MKKLLLLAAMFVFTLPVFAQTVFSANALVIRQSSTGVLSVQQTPFVNSFLGTSVCWTEFALNDPSNPDNFFYTALERKFSRLTTDKPFPMTGKMVVFFTSSDGPFVCLSTFPDDPSVTGTFIAFTSSFSTIENIIKDKIYSGL